MTLERFSLPVILLLAVAAWGATLYLSGIPLSWDHIKPYGITLAVVSGTLTAFDRLGWKWWPFRLLSKIPDLNGTWRVDLHSTYVVPQTGERVAPISGFASIRQTYSKLSIRLMTKDSASFLIASNVLHRDDGTIEIAGVYQSEPKVHLRGTESEIHYGSFKVRLVGNPVEAIDGHYWTDRHTKGTVAYTSRMNVHTDSFEAATRIFAANRISEPLQIVSEPQASISERAPPKKRGAQRGE
jgi:hypothetical protein